MLDLSQGKVQEGNDVFVLYNECMSEKKVIPKKVLGFEIDQSCIHLATQELKKDPDGQVIWKGSHAYFIPSTAGENDTIINLPITLKAGDKKIEVTLPPKSVRELRGAIDEIRVHDITNFLKRLIKR